MVVNTADNRQRDIPLEKIRYTNYYSSQFNVIETS
jgi:hypothetical protein